MENKVNYPKGFVVSIDEALRNICVDDWEVFSQGGGETDWYIVASYTDRNGNESITTVKLKLEIDSDRKSIERECYYVAYIDNGINDKEDVLSTSYFDSSLPWEERISLLRELLNVSVETTVQQLNERLAAEGGYVTPDDKALCEVIQNEYQWANLIAVTVAADYTEEEYERFGLKHSGITYYRTLYVDAGWLSEWVVDNDYNDLEEFFGDYNSDDVTDLENDAVLDGSLMFTYDELCGWKCMYDGSVYGGESKKDICDRKYNVESVFGLFQKGLSIADNAIEGELRTLAKCPTVALVDDAGVERVVCVDARGRSSFIAAADFAWFFGEHHSGGLPAVLEYWNNVEAGRV